MPFWKRKHKHAEIRMEDIYPKPRSVPNAWQGKYPLDVGALAAKGIYPEMSKEAKLALLQFHLEDLAKMAIPEPPPRFTTVEEADRWLEEHS
jgi:hypothetical protein